ncbi:hypothetical protein [Nonomuraea rubra]|uniref:hypothetical protein n=1 Tax=Nonomuraea rubra TaxID=46180 RepID=UPI0033FD64A8
MRNGLLIACTTLALTWTDCAGAAVADPGTRALAPAAQCRYWTAGDDPVRVQAGPGASYPTLGWIAGASGYAIVAGCSGDWVQIDNGSFAGGWLQRSLLSPVVRPDP